MRMEHLVYLACPRCGGSLVLGEHPTLDDGHVMEGTLRCERCSTLFPVLQGVPRLLPELSARSPVRENVARAVWLRMEPVPRLRL